ncbi:MAG: phosphoribosylformylglycinamidine cyclo-ligase [Acidobacteriota bacterium]
MSDQAESPDIPKGNAYRDAGVDIDAQEDALGRIKAIVKSTATEGVLADIGSFGGLFRPSLEGVSEPVLVASADGVGTKLMVAKMMGDFTTVGQDLVNHCVNDILVQGATPLFFLDYVGAGVLEPESLEALVSGVAAGCRENGCALLGGETAEMPGFYQTGDYEVVGFIVGLLDRGSMLGSARVRPGDVLLGLPSSGLHTNGYSLARKVLFEDMGLGVHDPLPSAPDGPTVGQRLLEVHRTYLPAMRQLLGHPGLHGLAHVTGGGLTDNLPRSLPEGTCAVVDTGAWEVPEIFRVIEEEGEISRAEMLRVFNMGVGMVLIVDAESTESIMAMLQRNGEAPFLIGRVETGAGDVVYRREGPET